MNSLNNNMQNTPSNLDVLVRAIDTPNARVSTTATSSAAASPLNILASLATSSLSSTNTSTPTFNNSSSLSNSSARYSYNPNCLQGDSYPFNTSSLNSSSANNPYPYPPLLNPIGSLASVTYPYIYNPSTGTYIYNPSTTSTLPFYHSSSTNYRNVSSGDSSIDLPPLEREEPQYTNLNNRSAPIPGLRQRNVCLQGSNNSSSKSSDIATLSSSTSSSLCSFNNEPSSSSKASSSSSLIPSLFKRRIRDAINLTEEVNLSEYPTLQTSSLQSSQNKKAKKSNNSTLSSSSSSSSSIAIEKPIQIKIESDSLSSSSMSFASEIDLGFRIELQNDSLEHSSISLKALQGETRSSLITLSLEPEEIPAEIRMKAIALHDEFVKLLSINDANSLIEADKVFNEKRTLLRPFHYRFREHESLMYLNECLRIGSAFLKSNNQEYITHAIYLFNLGAAFDYCCSNLVKKKVQLYLELGKAYDLKKQPLRALDLFRKSLSLLTSDNKIECSELKAELHMRLAIQLKIIKEDPNAQHESIKHTLFSLKELQGKSLNIQNQLCVANVLADSLFYEKKYHAAITILTPLIETLDNSKELQEKDKFNHARAHYTLAECLKNKLFVEGTFEDLSNAKSHYEKALQIFDEKDIKPKLQAAFQSFKDSVPFFKLKSL